MELDFFMVAVAIPDSFPYKGVAIWIHHFHIDNRQ